MSSRTRTQYYEVRIGLLLRDRKDYRYTLGLFRRAVAKVATWLGAHNVQIDYVHMEKASND